LDFSSGWPYGNILDFDAHVRAVRGGLPLTIRNGGFESGKLNWKFYTNGAGSFSIVNTDPYEGAKNARVTITRSGSNVQLYQPGIAVGAPPYTYELRLAARSSGGEDVALYLHKDMPPYTNYGLNGVVLDLTSEWQVFVVEFRAQVPGLVTDGRLRLWLAPYDAPGAEFEFDNVVLSPKG
jgi:hypothetical protein